MSHLPQYLVLVWFKLIEIGTKMFSKFLQWRGPNFLKIYCITHTYKKVEFWPGIWVVKDTNEMFKVVTNGY